MSDGANLAFDLSSDVGRLLEGLRAFVDSEVLTRQDRAGPLLSDARHRYTDDGRLAEGVLDLVREVRMASAEAGYYTMFVPASIGGGGLGNEALYRVWEDLHHRYGPHQWLVGWVVAHWARGPSHVLAHATAEVREKVLPELLSGRASLCFAMSEPDAGSDARRMRTRALAGRDGWVLSGRKIWITNGPYADYAVVFARAEHEAGAGGAAGHDEGRGPGASTSSSPGGITAFLVPTSAPGFRVESTIRMFGEIGGDEAEIALEEVPVGREWQLGDTGEGFRIAMSGVSSGRVFNAARAVGLARWALEKATAYTAQREAFGHSISEYQGVSFPLADSAIEVHAAHLVGLNCALLLDRGLPATKELSMAKAFSTDVAVRAIDRAIQVHGAMGFTNELGLVDAYESIRKARVADGTSEILRRTIAGRLLAGDLDL
jgi:acyl-CoA dehydrogenase